MDIFAPDFSLPDGATEVVRGTARVIDVQELDGGLIKFTLSNSADWTHAQIDEGVADRCYGFIEEGVVDFVADWTQDFGLHIRSCEIAASTIETFPIVRCPSVAREAFRRLVEIIGGMQTTHLRRFVELSLSARDQYIDLMTLPASGGCHHGEEGGLLIHTAEAAGLAKKIGLEMFDDQASRDLAIALAVVHDFGKLYRPFEGYRYTDVCHEDLMLPAVQTGIEYLRLNAPEVANSVIHGLTTGRRAKAPSSPESIVARLADWVSASKDARDRAFDGKPKSHFFTRAEYGSSTRTFVRIPQAPEI